MKSHEQEILEGLESPEEELRHRALQDIPKVYQGQLPIALLLKGLGDPSWRVRKTATEIILKQPSDAMFPVLVQALGDEENAGLRNSATEVLIRFGRPVVPLLVQLLQKGDRDERKFSADILGAVGDGQAVPALLESLVRDADANVRAAAAEALGHFNGHEEVKTELIAVLLEAALLVQLSILSALERLEVEVPYPILSGLLSVRPLRPQLIQLLANLRVPEVVPVFLSGLVARGRAERIASVHGLVRFFRRADKQTQVAVRVGVGKLDLERLCDHLLELLKSSDTQDRESAVVILGWTGRSEIVPELIQAAEDERLRDMVAEALLTIGPKAVDLIGEMLPDLGRSEKALALDILGHFRIPKSLPWIVELCLSEDSEIIEPAVRALRLIGSSEAIAPLVDKLGHGPRECLAGVVAGLSELGNTFHDEVVGELRPWLLSEQAERRRAAAEVLCAVARKNDLAWILPLLSDGDSTVRGSALLAVGRVGDTGVIERLRVALTDENLLVRTAAAKALGVRDDPEAGRALLVALSDSDPAVVCEALSGLRRLADPSMRGTVLALSQHAEGVVALAAVRTLNRIGWGEEEGPLLRASRHPDPEVVKEVLNGCGQEPRLLWKQVLRQAIEHPRWDVRLAAAKQVGAWKDKDSVEALVAHLPKETDELVRAVITRVLGLPEGKSEVD